jgi:hypothetical protein
VSSARGSSCSSAVQPQTFVSVRIIVNRQIRTQFRRTLAFLPNPPVSINPGATHNAPELPEIAWPSNEIGSAFDATADFAWLFSSRLPTVQTGGSSDTSPNEGASGISPTVRQGDRGPEGGRIAKVTWWRPHGQTAIAPGKRAVEAIVLGAQGHRTQAHDAAGSSGRHSEPWECSAGSVSRRDGGNHRCRRSARPVDHAPPSRPLHGSFRLPVSFCGPRQGRARYRASNWLCLLAQFNGCRGSEVRTY